MRRQRIELLQALGFGAEADRILRGECPFCGRPTEDEEPPDELSQRELEISGLCLACQEKVFDQKEE